MQLDLSNPAVQAAIQSKYMFPGAYGGFVGSPNPPQIHDMMKQLRVEIGAVEAKKSTEAFGPKFPVRGAKDLAQKLANALNKLNMEAPVVDQVITLVNTNDIPKNENKSGGPVFRTLAHVKATVRLIAPDSSFIDMVGSGHGGDVDDKSGGKASTYAWKDAILKGLSIPHEDMVDTDDDSSTGGEESRAGRAARDSAARPSVKGAVGKGQDAGGGGASGSAGKVAVPGGQVQSVVSGERANASGDTTGPAGIKEVTAAIAGATTEPEMESIRSDIKAGVYALHGADKLKATTLWVNRKKELNY